MNSEIEIIDNFLQKEYLNKLKSIFLSDTFPWYYQKGKIYVDDPHFQFTHSFLNDFEEKPNSSWFKEIIPFLHHLKAKNIYRMKLNMTFKEKVIKTFPMHVDLNYDCLTSVFYLNTNNGKTIFNNGKEINSVENRLIVFPSHLLHSGTTHTDEDIRVVLNSNFKR
jgi:hypothetical protein